MIRDLKFNFLLKRHADEIFRFTRGILGDAAEAEDVTQEVFLKLWHHLAEVRLSKGRAWLYQTARRHAIDCVRRRSAVSQPVLADGDSLPELPSGESDLPSSAADLPGLRDDLDRALQGLPEQYRAVFLLYELNGLRYREIATTLELPLNTVKVYLARARKQLQEQLKEHASWIRN